MSFNPTFHVVNGRSIHDSISNNMPEVLEVVREAYATFGRGEGSNPRSSFLTFRDNPSARIIALPAYLEGSTGSSGIKWIASYPANISRGVPRASAVLFLNSLEDGYPFACLESSIISAARTAASAVLGAEALLAHSPRPSTIGIVGTGLIAKYIYRFFARNGWAFEEVLLHDTLPGNAEAFQDEVVSKESASSRVRIAGLEDVLASSDLVVFATVAPAPYVGSSSAFKKDAVVLNISLRDLAPEVILDAFNVVDDVDHVMNAGTSPHLTEQRLGHRDFVAGTLADCFDGKVAVPDGGLRVFSPFGLGVLDIAVGKWAYERAVRLGEATEVPGFFQELGRYQ